MGIHRGKHLISYQRNKLLKLQRTAGRKNGWIPLFRNLCVFFSAQMQYLFHWDCAVLCLVAQSCATLWIPMDRGALQAAVHGDSPGKNTGVGCYALLQDLPNPGIEPRSPALQADSLLSEPPGKPKNTGVGSLTLSQGNFTTQESNQGLLHCKQILYQLSYPGSPVESVLNLILTRPKLIIRAGRPTQ